jgi:hypothetical protein
MTKERYQELRLLVGEQVAIRPRNVSLFPAETAAAG